ncbi:arginine N-succinyltransferase [Roseateles toxinivorans]|uniref:Arginine N-succinyltransferase n=1 Tax=Roseateles toxinivorans TaxID=270368 RepID=A0A4R6QN51_9BURK|nr:arginine N-succinyltransferase [Roseateles toxinivorans]TDP71560.1 arginine N-succinyltransferase [Roseateles toxinivorans]
MSALLVRPIAPQDAAAFMALHGGCNEHQVQALLAGSKRAFACATPTAEMRVFVLLRGDQLLGAAGLIASTGLELLRYSFRSGQVVHASAEMGMFKRAGTLVLGNDLTGAAELRLPLLAADAPPEAMALLLQAQLNEVLAQPQRFGATLICELAGQGDGDLASPFWQGLGRHFYSGRLPPDDAFFPPTLRSHIGRLLPKHPLYSSFLPETAQAALGRASASCTTLASLLHRAGLRARGQLSIVDGGPVLEAAVDELQPLVI